MPSRLIWKPDYSVGCETLDRQHQKLLHICTKLSECVSVTEISPEADAQFHEILNQLADFAREHFASEEAILSRFNSPLLQEQVAEHKAFVAFLAEILDSPVLLDLHRKTLYNFLEKWWVEHILVEDMKFREFLLT